MKTYGTNQVAEWLGVSERWLAKNASGKRFPHILIAGKIRFTEAHIEAIIAAYEVPVIPWDDKPSPEPLPRNRPEAKGALEIPGAANE